MEVGFWFSTVVSPIWIETMSFSKTLFSEVNGEDIQKISRLVRYLKRDKSSAFLSSNLVHIIFFGVAASSSRIYLMATQWEHVPHMGNMFSEETILSAATPATSYRLHAENGGLVN